MFHYKPSILGTPPSWKPPYRDSRCFITAPSQCVFHDFNLPTSDQTPALPPVPSQHVLNGCETLGWLGWLGWFGRSVEWNDTASQTFCEMSSVSMAMGVPPIACWMDIYIYMYIYIYICMYVYSGTRR